MGLVAAAGSFGQFAVVLPTMWMNKTFGWETSLIVLSIITISMLILLPLLNNTNEKVNQKKIMIGESGDNIKQIGIKARHKLEDIYSEKIYIDLTVKIKKNWKNDYNFLKNLGYIS